MKIIPAKQFAIREELGQFKSVLLPGLHFVFWPFQLIKKVLISNIKQDGSINAKYYEYIPMDNLQMDFPPVTCLSKDKIQLKVDLTCFYNVSDMKKIAYETNDPCNFLYQYAIESIKTVCYGYTADQVQIGNYSDITIEIRELLNQKISTVGLSCKNIIIQDISVNKSISDKEEAIFASKRQQQMIEDEEQAKYKREIQAIEHEKHKLELNNQMMLNKQKMEIELKLKDAEAEQRRRQMLDETPQYILEREKIKNQSKYFENANTVVLAPLDFFSNPSAPFFLHNKIN